jgi:hypothetical protein
VLKSLLFDIGTMRMRIAVNAHRLLGLCGAFFSFFFFLPMTSCASCGLLLLRWQVTVP